MSYGQVARESGYPRHARFVSRALKVAPRNLKLPWHRVINSAGKIAFPVGSEPYKTQYQRLSREGVLFVGNTVAKSHWIAQGQTLDKLLWGLPPEER